MIKPLMTAIFGTRFDRERKKIQPIVDQIHECEKQLKDLSESDLKAQTTRTEGRARAGPRSQARLRRSGGAGCSRGPLP
jgi:preprotein translocase subunit SecA